MNALTDLQWDSLVDAIRQEKCILFVGPDATTRSYWLLGDKPF
jgi:hypothetical protein